MSWAIRTLLSVGDPVVAIGTPYSISIAGTLTQGVISGVEREVTVSSGTGSGTKTMRLLQTDTTINPGQQRRPAAEYAGTGRGHQHAQADG